MVTKLKGKVLSKMSFQFHKTLIYLHKSESCLLPSTVHVRGIYLGKLVLDKTTENQELIIETMR